MDGTSVTTASNGWPEVLISKCHTQGAPYCYVEFAAVTGRCTQDFTDASSVFLNVSSAITRNFFREKLINKLVKSQQIAFDDLFVEL